MSDLINCIRNSSKPYLLKRAKEKKLKYVADMNRNQIINLLIMNEKDPSIMYLPEMKEKANKRFLKNMAKYKDSHMGNILRGMEKIKKKRNAIKNEATNARQRKIEIRRRSEEINREALKECNMEEQPEKIQSTAKANENAKKEVEEGLYKDISETEPNEEYWDNITEKKIEEGKYDRLTLNQEANKQRKEHILKEIKKIRDQEKTIEDKLYVHHQFRIMRDNLLKQIKNTEDDCNELAKKIKEKEEEIEKEINN